MRSGIIKSLKLRSEADDLRDFREIDRLNRGVQELQELLQNAESARNSPGPVVKARSQGTTFLPANLDPLIEHGVNLN